MPSARTSKKATIGRPTKFDQAMVAQARKLALLGATDEQVADFFEVNRDTVDAWKQKHRDFSDALKGGKAEADGAVAHSLYRRAKGYTRKAEKVFGPKDGTIVRADIREYLPPDVTACIFWLQNRQPALWRDAARGVPGQDAPVGINITLDAATMAPVCLSPAATAPERTKPH